MNHSKFSANVCALALGLAAALICISSAAADGAAHVRWDIISLDFGPPVVANAGGIASATAADGSMITMSGAGTFVTPAGGQGSNSSGTGGGTWETFDSGGSSTGSGTYRVTGLVRWDREPVGALPPAVGDNIGDPAERSAGLAILRIEYSDSSRGILVVNCRLPGSPAAIPEGISATKGFVDYFDVVPPVPLVDANRTVFHVRE